MDDVIRNVCAVSRQWHREPVRRLRDAADLDWTLPCATATPAARFISRPKATALSYKLSKQADVLLLSICFLPTSGGAL